MSTIPLTRGHVAIVDDAVFEHLSQWKWFTHTSEQAYACRKIRVDARDGGWAQRTMFMHRQILGLGLGRIPEVDHWNGNKLDNRRTNLRICTTSQNAANTQKPGGTSKYRGVSWESSRKKWRAQVMKDKRNIHVGRYDSEEDAARAYDEAAARMFGEFARRNFP